MHTQRIQAGRAPHAGFCKGLAPSQRHLATPHAAHPDSSSVPESVPPHIYLGDGDAIFLPKPRTEAGPSFEYDKEQAVEVQLQVTSPITPFCYAAQTWVRLSGRLQAPTGPATQLHLLVLQLLSCTAAPALGGSARYASLTQEVAYVDFHGDCHVYPSAGLESQRAPAI
eukprot:GHUV01018345.1.p1 GENE.GHUV01018345.1~~GHUV01018345.1.p1  ORF type:complete len:169 (+),score=14.98 GHUV01018345.1:182-688(+)